MAVVRIGLAGCGSVSQRGLIPHLAQEDTRQWCELTAVMDPVAGRARATAEKFGVPLWFEDYDEMLASDIDAVEIASPIGVHYEQALKAIAAGKHLHLNKTFTTTKAEADEVIEAAGRRGVKIAASPGEGLRPDMRRVKEIIQSGEIGHVYWAECGASWKGPEFEQIREGEDVLTRIDPAWFYKRPGGGPMYHFTVYALHRITALLGPVRRISGMSGVRLGTRSYKGEAIGVDMDDNTHLLLDFGDSVYGLVFGSMSFTGPARPFAVPFISATRGAIVAGTDEEGTRLDVWGDHIESGHRLERPGRAMPFVFGPHLEIPERHVYSDLMHLVDCVLNGKEPVVSADHARHVIEIIELGYKAAATGQTQEVTTTFTLGELAVDGKVE